MACTRSFPLGEYFIEYKENSRIKHKRFSQPDSLSFFGQEGREAQSTRLDFVLIYYESSVVNMYFDSGFV